jgi:hypothetical protein
VFKEIQKNFGIFGKALEEIKADFSKDKGFFKEYQACTQPQEQQECLEKYFQQYPKEMTTNVKVQGMIVETILDFSQNGHSNKNKAKRVFVKEIVNNFLPKIIEKDKNNFLLECLKHIPLNLKDPNTRDVSKGLKTIIEEREITITPFKELFFGKNFSKEQKKKAMEKYLSSGATLDIDLITKLVDEVSEYTRLVYFGKKKRVDNTLAYAAVYDFLKKDVPDNLKHKTGDLLDKKVTIALDSPNIKDFFQEIAFLITDLKSAK